MTKIQEILYRHQDQKYGDFLSKLVPNMPREAFIGIRSPEYKKIIKEVHTEAEEEIEKFMNSLPHEFQEENSLQVMLISEIKDYESCVAALEQFLPYINNWAISDGVGAKAFDKNHHKLILKISEWIKDDAFFNQLRAVTYNKASLWLQQLENKSEFVKRVQKCTSFCFKITSSDIISTISILSLICDIASSYVYSII